MLKNEIDKFHGLTKGTSMFKAHWCSSCCCCQGRLNIAYRSLISMDFYIYL
jgi:hypothetical protein